MGRSGAVGVTLVKAQACMSAIAGAGFDVTAHFDSTLGGWVVRATSASLTIDSAQIASLVASQGVTGKVSLVEFT